jgi:ribose transport system permease protein
MLAAGAAVGVVNGVIFVYGRVPHAFVVTLATLGIARGLAFVLSQGRPLQGMPELVLEIGGSSIGRWPISAFVVIGLAVVVATLCTRVVWGGWIYAVGGNPDAARRAAIPVNGVVVSVYVLCGLSAGVAGVLTAGRTGAGAPTFGEGAELDAIAAVIIGGASFAGGRGHVGNALVGALIIGVIRNALNLVNVTAFYQLIVIGVVILVAVESDVLRGYLEGRVRTAQAARQQ